MASTKKDIVIDVLAMTDQLRTGRRTGSHWKLCEESGEILWI